MSFARGLRTALRQSAPQARHNSSAASASSAAAAARKLGLPPEKLRALISLYHESGSFITKENLDDHIDKEFGKLGIGQFDGRPTERYKLDLDRELAERRREPRFGSKVRMADGSGYSTLRRRRWSSGDETEREKRVYAALFGTDMQETRKPGLEILREEQERIEREFREEEAEKPASEC